ncbi:penicillin-binding protein 2 [Alphaproteobacteria bacterium]|nr:penicillin-binding protein 2 [Alphaproteobacteria bacterium]
MKNLILKNNIKRRFFLLTALKGISFGILSWRLFDLQVIENKKYDKLSKDNQFNFSLVVPERGQIYDRKGRVLAANRDAFSLYIKSSENLRISEILNKLLFVTDLNEEDINNFKKRYKNLNKNNINIFITDDLSQRDISKIAVRLHEFPEVNFLMTKKRVYPQGAITSHLIGYTGKLTEKDLKKNKNLINFSNLRIGKYGLEKYFDNQLRGEFGRRREEVNARGKIITSNLYEKPNPGKNLNLSIDLNIQSFALSRLQNINLKKIKHSEPETGSVVVMDVNTGELICCVSSPNFNPNIFTRGVKSKEWEALINNKKAPLLNRAVSGLYSPGSTIKMAVALAALENGIIGYDNKFFCNGAKEYGDMKFHCWYKNGHGNINLSQAIERSCDVFFYELGLKVGIEKIGLMLKKLGLSANIDLELNELRRGLVPSKKWKLDVKGKPWTPGETINASIGQGYMLSNPIELVTMTSRIANSKWSVEPTLLSNKIQKFAKLDINKNHLNYIKNAMSDVVNSEFGTAYKSRLRNTNVKMAGKTGTVQVIRISEEEREKGIIKNKDREWKKRDHALFVGYAPLVQPKFSVCVIVEHGGSGSSTAAPIAKDIIEKLLI